MFTVFLRRQIIAYCGKHRDFGKVVSTQNDDQLKIQHTSHA